MCGLVGVAGLVTAKEENVLKQLLIVDSLRGVDSTGVAVITRSGDTRVVKQVGNPYELLDHHQMNKAFAGLQRAIIGHNRFGTQGKSTKANAHPFEFETVVGAHNGTVHTKCKMKDGNQFDVDSAAIYNHIDTCGLNDLMKVMGGAWALTWWDKIEEKLNFLRNKERPLYLTTSKDGKCLFWASEYWMLSGVLSRNGIEFDKIEMLPVDTHVSIEIAKDGSMSKPHAVPCPSTYVVDLHPVQHKTYLSPSKLPDVVKTGVVPQAAKPLALVSSKDSLSNAKQVSLEVLSLVDNDGYGGRYLSCYSAKWPYANIRWYFPRGVNTNDFLTEIIIADVGQRIDRGQMPSYYKVESNTVVLESDLQDRDEEEKQYRNARGRMVSESVWIGEHGECAYCSDNIRPTDKHAFSSAYQCFCGSCMEKDDVKQYTQFTTLVYK